MEQTTLRMHTFLNYTFAYNVFKERRAIKFLGGGLFHWPWDRGHFCLVTFSFVNSIQLYNIKYTFIG